jgi:hypothetical protein
MRLRGLFSAVGTTPGPHRESAIVSLRYQLAILGAFVLFLAVLFAAEYVDLRAVGETSGSAEGRTLRVSKSTLPPP